MAKLVGTDQLDILEGTDKKDEIFGRGGNDDLRGNGGNDKIYGGNGDDHLYGGNLIDKSIAKHPELFKNDGRDELDGGIGNDFLFGGTGNDILKGGADNDTLSGGLGADVLFGGEGKDTFQLDNNDVWDLKTNAHFDTIKDFEKGDKIDLELIDANTGKMGDDAFKFVGQVKQGALLNAGEVGFVIDKATNETWVVGAVDSKGVNDVAIVLEGQHQLTVSDFVL